MREVKIQLYLNHPNIVKLYGLFHDVQHVYLVMEYCSGGHLFGLMRERRQFEEGQVMRVLGNLFEAVAYIHSNGVIHRDLKPENIVIEHVRIIRLRKCSSCAISGGRRMLAGIIVLLSAVRRCMCARRC